jgi:predicted ATPase
MKDKGFLLSMSLKSTENINWSQYPFNVSSIRHLKNLDFHPAVTFLIGENGTGKSTLIEALAISQRFNPEGGTKNFTFSTIDTHSVLFEYLKVVKSDRYMKDGFFLRGESFYNMASYIDAIQSSDNRMLKSYGNRSLHNQSHGESFFALMKYRFNKEGLYILDEPETALSPQKQIAMLMLIDELVNKGSQFIISTHSPILLAYPNAIIYEIDKKQGLKKTIYEKSDIYTTTIDFLNNYQIFLKHMDIKTP